jgi:PAS domain S-box-containing protein
MDWLTWLGTFTGLITSIISIAGFLWGGWKLIIAPIKKVNGLLTSNSAKLNKALDTIDNDLLPFMKSMTAEFSKNSGKSIKDQLTRIDENTKLSDLRIKLIATNLVSTGTFECDSTGKTVWVNKALAEIFGLEREEMLDNGWLTAVHDDERADVWADWIYSLNNKIPYESEYTVYNRKTNTIFKVRVVAIANKTDTGKILGYFGTVVKV